MNNLKQLYLAFNEYCDSKDDWCMPSSGISATASNWVQYMQENKISQKMLTCRAESRTCKIGTTATNNMKWSHYIVNQFVMAAKGKSAKRNRMRKRTVYKQPSIVKLIMDSNSESESGAGYTYLISFRHGAGDPRPNQSLDVPAQGASCNVLFLAGQVTSMQASAFLRGVKMD